MPILADSDPAIGENELVSGVLPGLHRQRRAVSGADPRLRDAAGQSAPAR